MLLDGDGFDHYGGTIANMLDGIIAANDSVTLSTTQVRTGTHSMRFPSGNGSTVSPDIRRVIPAGLRDTIGVGFGMFWEDLPTNSNNRGVHFLDINGNAIASFDFKTDGRVGVHRGNNSGSDQLGVSSLPVLNSNAWNFVEFKIGAHASVGSTGMRVNNIEVDGLMLTNQNTAGTANLISQIRLGDRNTAQTMVMYVDDYLVWDALGDDNNDWLGDQQLIWRPPTADHPSLPVEFVPSTGATLWDLIDEASPSAADYIRALAADKQAAFEYADLPAEITDVIGVIPYIFAKKLNSGTCTVNLGMLSNGVVGNGLYQAVGPDVQITTVDTFWRTVLERNPDTNLPWTPAEINAAYLHLDRVA